MKEKAGGFDAMEWMEFKSDVVIRETLEEGAYEVTNHTSLLVHPLIAWVTLEH